MKPSSRSPTARLYLSVGAAALVVMMTLGGAANGRQLVVSASRGQQQQQQRQPSSKVAANPEAPARGDSLALASTQRQARRALATRATGGSAPDLSVGQSSIANAEVHLSAQDMTPAAAGHYGAQSHGKYYMYAESPKKGAYKMGFKRGNHKHLIERKESAHKGHVSSYFKWHAKKGKGSHKFEFKHYDKKAKHYG